VLVQAKRLTCESLDAIARHRAAKGTRCDRQTQARTLLIISQYREAEVGVGQFFAALPDLAKFDRQVQTLARFERQPRNGLGNRYKDLREASGTEALAALRPTASQQLTAALGGHTRAESVSTGTM